MAISSHRTSFLDNLIDYSSVGLLIANWAYPLSSLKHLPEKIPIQFGLKGQILKEGSRNIILLTSLIGTFGLVSYALKARAPERAAYSLTKDTTDYKSTCKLLRSLHIFNGFFVQLTVFGVNFLLLHGHKLDNDIRASWITKGLIGLVLTALIGYGRFGSFLFKYILNK